MVDQMTELSQGY